MKKIILATLLAFPLFSLAEVTPSPGTSDPRVRMVNYNPTNVVKVTAFYGVSTHIQFSASETIKDVAIGDELAWDVAPRGNNLYIKPRAEQADTNLTIVTNKRTYQFILVVQPMSRKDKNAWANGNLIFSLSFRYPDEDVADRDLKAKIALEKAKQEEIKTRLSSVPEKSAHNMNYWVAGDNEISPTGAYDDGRFIYLTFTNNRDMPAIYEVDAKGKESLINTNVMSGNTITIQRLVPQVILRKGDLVASVINKSFNYNNGKDNTTGTVSPQVERVIRGD